MLNFSFRKVSFHFPPVCLNLLCKAIIYVTGICNTSRENLQFDFLRMNFHRLCKRDFIATFDLRGNWLYLGIQREVIRINH